MAIDTNRLIPADEDEGKVISIPKLGFTWAMLNQKHDCYDEERITKLELLLKGGYDITDNAKLFIKQWRAENSNAYADRLSFASYENNFGEIINDYGANLFAKPLMVVPATDSDDEETPGDEPNEDEDFMQFQRCFTLDEQSMAEFLRDIQCESNAVGCAYFGLDFDEEAKPYAYHIDPRSVLDWQFDDAGDIVFMILRNDDNTRLNVRQMRNVITSTFTVWTKDDETVRFDQYSITYPKEKEPGDDDIVPYVFGDTVSFNKVPIICAETPENLCIGELIGQLSASLFQRYSTFLFCLNRGLNPLLVYTQGAELPASGDLSSINEDEERGGRTLSTALPKGAALLGPGDDLSWIGPEKGPFEVASLQLDKDKNEIYRLVASMTNIINTKNQGTSATQAPGISKILDNQAKENMLSAYADLVKEWCRRAFDLVWSATGQDVVWQVKGMDNYTAIDEDSLLLKIQALPDYKANIPSRTSFKQVLLDIAGEMHPFVSPSVLAKIQEEINESVDSMEEEPGSVDAMKLQKGIDPNEPTAANGKAAPSSQVPSKNAPQSRTAPANGNPAPSAVPSSPAEIDPKTMFDRNQSTAGVAQTVLEQLKDDYSEKLLDWIPAAHWLGPLEVPLDAIDDSNRSNWDAASRTAKIEDMAEKMEEGWSKPIILVNEPNGSKLSLIDGHTRFLAKESTGEKTISAFVAYVGGVAGPWRAMHDLQREGEDGGKRTSQQLSSKQKPK